MTASTNLCTESSTGTAKRFNHSTCSNVKPPTKTIRQTPTERAALALLWVNRQIRDEVIFTPFSRPTFEGNLYRIHRLPEDLGPHRHLLQKVRARDISGPRLRFDESDVRFDHLPHMFSLMSTSTGLRSVTIMTTGEPFPRIKQDLLGNGLHKLVGHVYITVTYSILAPCSNRIQDCLALHGINSTSNMVACLLSSSLPCLLPRSTPVCLATNTAFHRNSQPLHPPLPCYKYILHLTVPALDSRRTHPTQRSHKLNRKALITPYSIHQHTPFTSQQRSLKLTNTRTLPPFPTPNTNSR